MSEFTFIEAMRQDTHVIVGMAGASGSGKTYSAMRLAAGLAGSKRKFAAIDTEAGRSRHYADRFKFDVCDLGAPFSPERYCAAIIAAAAAGYPVVMVDSMSHEHEGEGGLVEWAAQLEAGGTKSPGNWAVPKAAHKRMVSRILQLRIHLILCMRAEEKIKIEKITDEQSGRTKTVVVPAGWQPICEKRLPYELTASFLLTADRPGFPQFLKLQDQHRAAFPPDQPISEESGQALAAWASGGKAVDENVAALLSAGRDAARKGADALAAWWESIGKAKRQTLACELLGLKAISAAVEGKGDGLPADESAPTSGQPATTSAAATKADEWAAYQARIIAELSDAAAHGPDMVTKVLHRETQNLTDAPKSVGTAVRQHAGQLQKKGRKS